MQYTVRNVPSFLDRALRRMSRENGASLNDVLLEALARGAGLDAEPTAQRKLADLAGTWVEDRAFDDALREQDTVDDALWR